MTPDQLAEQAADIATDVHLCYPHLIPGLASLCIAVEVLAQALRNHIADTGGSAATESEPS